MRIIKPILLIVFMSFTLGLYAQSSFMLWGYSDNPKRADSFTFLVRPDGTIPGIVFTAGFDIESFSCISSDPLVFGSVSTDDKTIKIGADFKSAILCFPDGSSIYYRLANPPYALIQYFQNNANTNTNSGGSRVGKQRCSLCHGKGWIAGTSTPTYGNSSSYYCSECGRNVSASHSHDRCPSCGGTGTTQTIR